MPALKLFCKNISSISTLHMLKQIIFVFLALIAVSSLHLEY